MHWKVLITLSLVISEAVNAEVSCSKTYPCVRFCCENCTDLDVNDQPGADNFRSDYHVLRGRPCLKMYTLEPNDYTEDVWSFTEVK